MSPISAEIAWNSPHSGASMDRMLSPPPRWRRYLPIFAFTFVCLVVTALLLWQRVPQLEIVHSPQLAPVVAAEFRDDLLVRGRVEPIRSVQLDAAEAGRVEEVFARDGDWVELGAPLYRLHSPELEQLLMERGAEVAQQLANVSVQRSAHAASLAQSRRELAQLQIEQQQAELEYGRMAPLASAGFISEIAFEQAQLRWQLTSQLLQQAREDQQLEADIRQRSLGEMARAVEGLQRGLRMLERSRDRLKQRAPINGRLSGFQLQVGMTVRPADRLGRIDDSASGVQLAAEVDEFYLPRLQQGQEATSDRGTLNLVQILPQVHEGKVRVLLQWPEKVRPLGNVQPGQAVDVRLQLSSPTAALLLPDGPGVQSRLYVREGNQLLRRSVQLGRRAAGQVEVLSGLRAGEEVLISQPPSDSARLALP